MVVDVLGLVLSCFVSAANVADVKAAPVVLVPALEDNRRLVKILADQSYRGAISVLLQQAFDCTLELTKKLGQEFTVELWRWVVEGLGAEPLPPFKSPVNAPLPGSENARRLCRDYEELPEHHESFVYVTMIRLMLRKLTYNRRTR